MLKASLAPLRSILRTSGGQIRHARNDDSGAALIEFALITPAFVALLIAILQTALLFFAQETIESAAEAAARQITTGQVRSSNTTASQFQTLACQGLQAFMTCSKLMVDVQKYNSFDAVDTSTPTITYDANGQPTNLHFTTGGAGDIVVVRLMYNWPVVGGPLGFSLSNMSGSQHMLIATNVAKTEPYQ